ncbi:MAG: hypothetical protein J5804_05705, partial [Eggerthellaceae bacterium]|nr:hypothetical protein [Eggerthellaceae bacterium]
GKDCLVLYTDTVYREDYSRLLDAHKEMGADITFLYSKSPKLASDQATGLAQFEVDADGWVRGVNLSTEFDDSSCFSMGAFIMEKDLLVRMVEDACAEGKYSFFSDIMIPALATHKVAAVEHTGYAARISSVKSYFDISRDMFDFDTRQELYFDNGLVHTFDKDVPPVRFVDGCQVQQSIFGNGCVVYGNVEGSVVFRGTTIECDADIKDCIIMQNSRICEGAYLRNVIIDKDVMVGPGARIVGTPDMPAVVRKASVIVA